MNITDIVICVLTAVVVLFILIPIDCISLHKKTAYEHLKRSKRIVIVRDGDTDYYYMKFVSGYVLWLVPYWVYWKREYPVGKNKYRVANTKDWCEREITKIKMNYENYD